MEPLIRILHLEDDWADAELAQAALKSAGLACQITRVQTRDEFDQALRQESYDVILADYRLPMYNGIYALRLAQELAPDIPFIFVSGTMGEDAAIEGLTEGATDYVLKQKLSRLAPAVRRALHEAENQRERKRAEEALRILSRAVEQSPASIVITDTSGVIEYVNPKFTELTGYMLEEAVGKNPRILKSGRTLPEEYARLWSTITSGGEWRGEVCNRKRDGEMYWESVSISPVINEAGITTHFVAVKEDITQRKQVEEQLHALLREKDVLLAEIHHRVKNNMQVIISLLRLQARGIQDERALAAFRESQNRVKSMALVHEQLYRSQDFAQIDLAPYIRDLTTNLFHLYGVDPSVVRLQITVEAVSLEIETAIPCGLILNELLTNCLKHAFPAGRPGQINIQVRRDDHHVVLVVSDDGVGLPSGLNWQSGESLGLQLVNLLVTGDLGGSLELNQAGGTEFRITFPSPGRKA